MDTTIVKGFRILEELIRLREPQGVADLAKLLGLSKSNVHRVLQTLGALGYVSGHNGRYSVTLKVWSLGLRVIEGVDIKHLAMPVMQSLAERSGETVHLSVYEQGCVVYIEKVESSHPIRAYSEIGGRAPAYCVATGKALLAHQSEEEMERVLGALERHSPNTIVSPEALRITLEQVRANHYAINRGEWREQVSGVGAPIWSASGGPVAAIGISGPAARFNEEALALFIPMVRESADALSRIMGRA